MPTSVVNGVRLYWETDGGDGPAVVLVHGSWVDLHNWDLVRPLLARRFRVLSYDRRGHSQSERPAGQGSAQEDAEDLAALMSELGFAPAHLVGNSFGGSIALRLAATRPGHVRSLVIHEPPLFGLLDGVPEAAPYLAEFRRRLEAVLERLWAGRHEEAAELFVDTVAIGPGTWARLAPEERAAIVSNAPTFLDEARDPDMLVLDLPALSGFSNPALLGQGEQSFPLFTLVLDQLAAALPRARRRTFAGAGHIPHLSHPQEYVEAVTALALARD